MTFMTRFTLYAIIATGRHNASLSDTVMHLLSGPKGRDHQTTNTAPMTVMSIRNDALEASQPIYEVKHSSTAACSRDAKPRSVGASETTNAVGVYDGRT